MGSGSQGQPFSRTAGKHAPVQPPTHTPEALHLSDCGPHGTLSLCHCPLLLVPESLLRLPRPQLLLGEGGSILGLAPPPPRLLLIVLLLLLLLLLQGCSCGGGLTIPAPLRPQWLLQQLLLLLQQQQQRPVIGLALCLRLLRQRCLLVLQDGGWQPTAACWQSR